MGGACSDVNGNIQYFAFDYAAQFCLWTSQLIVQPAQSPLARGRMVVLYEQVADAQFKEFSPVIGLHEKTPGIPKHCGAQLPDTRESRFDLVHRQCVSCLANVTLL